MGKCGAHEVEFLSRRTGGFAVLKSPAHGFWFLFAALVDVTGGHA